MLNGSNGFHAGFGAGLGVYYQGTDEAVKKRLDDLQKGLDAAKKALG